MYLKSRRLLFAGVTAVFAALVFVAPVLATLDSVSGHAYGESVDVTTLGLVHITSGPLPSTGELTANGSNSPLDNSALSVCVPAITCTTLSTEALTVHTDGTTGATGSVHSTASVVNVNALAGLVTGAVIASQCAVDSAGNTSGSSTLTTVQVNGVTVASNPGPNTVLVLLDAGSLVIGSVTLNEQIYDSGTNTLTVNAIHIHLASGSLGTGDIIIAQSQCDALPAGTPPVIPESPLAILLPLTALAVVGGLFVLTIRRRAPVESR
jgi:hypothetical protein